MVGLTVHREAREDAPPRRRGDERRGRGRRSRDRRHLERRGYLRRERLVEEAEHHPHLGLDLAGGERGVEVGEIVVGGEDHGLRASDPRLLERLLEPPLTLDDRDVEVEELRDEGRLQVALDGDHVLAQLEEILDDVVADLPGADDDDVVAHDGRVHDVPLRELLFLREDVVAEPHERVGHGADAYHRDEEEEGLHRPALREAEVVLREDHRQDAVAALDVPHVLRADRERLDVGLRGLVEVVDDKAASEDEREEDGDRQAELSLEEPGVAIVRIEPALAHPRRGHTGPPFRGLYRW